MPVGLHPANEVRRVKRPKASDGGREMRVRIPPLERSLRTASRHLSSPRPVFRDGECCPGLHPGKMSLRGRLERSSSPSPNTRLANAGGTTSVQEVRILPGAIRMSRHLSSPAPNIRRMPVGLRGRALAVGQEVGGSNPLPGNRIAQSNRLTTARRRNRRSKAWRMPTGLQGLEGRRFESGRASARSSAGRASGTSRHTLVATL